MYIGARNGVKFGMWDENNPQLLSEAQEETLLAEPFLSPGPFCEYSRYRSENKKKICEASREGGTLGREPATAVRLLTSPPYGVV